MKKILIFLFVISSILTNVSANIVDRLTELNNLYKSGAINEDEFSKA